MGNVRLGRCALTQCEGRFVDSHIIPQALTEQTWKGEPLTQRGRNGRLIKRWTSWYDPRLVTEEGEKILASYDDFAVGFFRRHKLTWSSWGDDFELHAPDHEKHPELGFGHRIIPDVDTSRLRLFLLSLLWRAAATSLFEFGDVALSPGELERLRIMVLEGLTEPQTFFPATLIQLSTRNFPHNRSAYRSVKREPSTTPDGEPDFDNPNEVPHFRFWLDGLIVHIHLDEDGARFAERKEVFVGPTRNLRFVTLPSETSSEMKWFEHDVQEADANRNELPTTGGNRRLRRSR